MGGQSSGWLGVVRAVVGRGAGWSGGRSGGGGKRLL